MCATEKLLLVRILSGEVRFKTSMDGKEERAFVEIQLTAPGYSQTGPNSASTVPSCGVSVSNVNHMGCMNVNMNVNMRCQQRRRKQ